VSAAGHVKYREHVFVPAATHLQYPVQASSLGGCEIGAVANPVIS